MKHVQIPADYEALNFDSSPRTKPKSKMVEAAPGHVVQVPIIDKEGKPETEPVMVKAIDFYGALVLGAMNRGGKREHVLRAHILQTSLTEALRTDRVWSMDDDHWQWLKEHLEERKPPEGLTALDGLVFEDALLNASKDRPESPETGPTADPDQT